ncbi:MAG: MMPL family transporter [Bacteroidota bacterium]
MKSKNQLLLRYADALKKYRWFVALGTILLGFGIGSGAAHLKFNSDYHAYFSESNPQLEAFDNLQNIYTKDESVIIALSPQDGTIFTKPNLVAIEQMTNDSWNIPYNSRVDAVTNFQHTRAVEDDLYVGNLVEDAQNLSTAAIAEIKTIALNDPILKNKLVNEEGSVTAINVTIKLPGQSDEELNEVIQAVESQISSWKEQYPNFAFHITGVVPMNNAFFTASTTDGKTLIPAMFGLVLLLIGFLTRSITATLATLVVIVLSICTAAGFGGFVGIQLTPASAIFPTIILTLAVADSIHILISILQKMKEGQSKEAAIKESLMINFIPVSITSLTTIIGFLTLNTGDVPPYWDLGNLTAVGMLGAFVFSLSTLPALIHILPLKVRPVEQYQAQSTIYERLGLWIGNRPLPTLGFSMVFLLIMGTLASKNILNDEFIKYFNPSMTFRTDSDYISENLTGMYNIEYSVKSGESGGISNPEYLSNLSKFESWLKSQPEITHVTAFTEVSKKVNKSMHGDAAEYYKTPSSREEAAQYLLLYEMSLPFGLDLNNQINVDKSETRVTITTKDLRSQEIIVLNQRIENWLAENSPEYMHALGSSTVLMFAYLGERQSSSITKGNIIAIILISLILLIVFRNVRIGLLSLIPNIAPIVVGFGIWYLFSGEVNIGMIVVFGMTLGIIVDDTVHFLSKYLYAKRTFNYNAKEAVIYAFSSVGKALMVTTIVLVFGFAVLSQSAFLLNSSMAQISLIVMIAALLIDFILLPALLVLVDGRRDDLVRPSLINIQ